MSTATTSEASRLRSLRGTGRRLFTPRLTTVVCCSSTFVDLGIFASGFHGGVGPRRSRSRAVFASDHSTVRAVTTADGSGNLGSGAFIGQPTVGGFDAAEISIALSIRDAEGVTATSTGTWSCLAA